MPFYEYKCKDCGRDFEEFQKMSDDPLVECSECKGTVVRLISLGVCRIHGEQEDKNVIKQDAKDIVNKIRGGDEDEAANFFGEDFVKSGAHKDLIRKSKIVG